MPWCTRTSSSGDEPASSSGSAGRLRLFGGVLRRCRRAAQRAFRREAQEEHIGAGIDGAQRAIDLEAVQLRLDVEALREDGLKDVAGGDVLLGAGDGGQEVLLAGAVLHLELGLAAAACAASLGSGWARRFSSLSRRLTALVVGVGRLAVGDVGGDHQPDLLAHVVEGQHLIEEEQAGVGNAELVFGQRGQALDLAHGIVGKEADRAGGERRQAGQARRLVAAERVAQHGEDVAFDARGLSAFGDGDLAAAGHDALEGREADEGVAAHLLAALDRLQQKALALRPGRAQKGRDRGFEVGGEGAADGHQGVLFGERQELFAAGLDGMA